jgi:tetratricopeptide (TPR) repeat protein
MKAIRAVVMAGLLALTGSCHQVHEAKARQLIRSSVEAFYEGEFDKALEHSEIALRLGSKEPELHRVRSAIFLRRGDAETALEEADAGLALFHSAAGEEETELTAEAQSRHHTDRSNVLQALGRSAEGLAALREAVRLDPENAGAQNNLAWLLATSPEASLRDGKAAVEHARQACERTDWREAGAIDTLAAAYAEAGDFEQAVKWQVEAISRMTDDELETETNGFDMRLNLYEGQKPFREDPVAEYQARVTEETGGDGEP